MDPKEMKNEAPEKVTGGAYSGIKVKTDDRETNMVCTNCNHSERWAGEFVNKTFECPRCHENTLTGKYIV